MDPDAALAEMLDLARDLIKWDDALIQGDHDPTYGQAAELAQAVLALHEWIDHGGFLPAAWRATAGATPFIGDPFPADEPFDGDGNRVRDK